jgi:hypothetical protein
VTRWAVAGAGLALVVAVAPPAAATPPLTSKKAAIVGRVEIGSYGPPRCRGAASGYGVRGGYTTAPVFMDASIYVGVAFDQVWPRQTSVTCAETCVSNPSTFRELVGELGLDVYSEGIVLRPGVAVGWCGSELDRGPLGSAGATALVLPLPLAMTFDARLGYGAAPGMFFDLGVGFGVVS